MINKYKTIINKTRKNISDEQSEKTASKLSIIETSKKQAKNNKVSDDVRNNKVNTKDKNKIIIIPFNEASKKKRERSRNCLKTTIK